MADENKTRMWCRLSFGTRKATSSTICPNSDPRIHPQSPMNQLFEFDASKKGMRSNLATRSSSSCQVRRSRRLQLWRCFPWFGSFHVCASATSKRSPTSELWVRTGRDMTTTKTAWNCFAPWSLTKQKQPDPAPRKQTGNSHLTRDDRHGGVDWVEATCGYCTTNVDGSVTSFMADASFNRAYKKGLVQAQDSLHIINCNSQNVFHYHGELTSRTHNGKGEAFQAQRAHLRDPGRLQQCLWQPIDR